MGPAPAASATFSLFGVALLFCAAGCGQAAHAETGVARASTQCAAITSAAVAREAPPTNPPPSNVVHEPEPNDDAIPATLEEQRTELYARMRKEHFSDEAVARVAEIFAGSPYIGQGNPQVSKHAMTRAQCRAVRRAHKLARVDDPRCGARDMVPLFDVDADETAKDATVCIDQFEFPGYPCEYPVTYARANEAVDLCAAVGKRICDAHEWEGACAGSLHPPDFEYAFGMPRPYATYLHNQWRPLVWSYGDKKDFSKCATGAQKSEKCEAGGWSLCGTNTWPTGSFPDCVSSFGVYDLHGNAAEHMNLALKPEELASRGGRGETEMKGSWFIFANQEAHEDDCHWRAKDWHPSKITAKDSHRNYHLGLRCCKDVGEQATSPSPARESRPAD